MTLPCLDWVCLKGFDTKRFEKMLYLINELSFRQSYQNKGVFANY